MTSNVGNIDRLLRLVLGAVLLVLPFVLGWEGSVMRIGAVVVGLVLIGTASIKFCPLYRILGMSTCPR